MTQRWTDRLEGLEPDNFLAFMALLGLLRALETARPDWCPRAAWDLKRAPWRPVLSLRTDVSREEVAAAAAEGVTTLAVHQEFPNGNERQKAIDFSQNEARDALKDAERNRRTVVECLLTPAAYKDDGKPMPTPYCLMFGQGHQHFLERFAAVPAMPAPPNRGRGKKAVAVPPQQSIAEALFDNWQRIDLTDSFRWDAVEANRYALRAKNPSSDPEAKTTQHGANSLAAIALPLLPAIAIARRGEPRTLAVGARYLPTGDVQFTWPIWTAAVSLGGILSLLRTSPDMFTIKDENGARPAGVEAVARAERISLGKFMNVTPARIEPAGAVKSKQPD